MIINRTIGRLDYWVAKLELAYKRLTLLVEGHCLGSKVVREAREMEELYFPQADWIIDAIHERIQPIQGYRPVTVQTYGEISRRNKLGV